MFQCDPAKSSYIFSLPSHLTDTDIKAFRTRAEITYLHIPFLLPIQTAHRTDETEVLAEQNNSGTSYHFHACVSPKSSQAYFRPPPQKTLGISVSLPPVYCDKKLSAPLAIPSKAHADKISHSPQKSHQSPSPCDTP